MSDDSYAMAVLIGERFEDITNFTVEELCDRYVEGVVRLKPQLEAQKEIVEHAFYAAWALYGIQLKQLNKKVLS